MTMKTTREITYGQVIWTALLVELTLAAAQFLYLTFYSRSNPAAEIILPSEYLKTGGFYIFQVVGMAIYILVVYIFARSGTSKLINKVLILVVMGGAIELSAYIMMESLYAGLIVLSFLDKLLAASIGLWLYTYASRRVNRQSYVQ